MQAEAQVRAQAAALAYAQTEVERYTSLRRKGAAAQVVVDNWNFQAQEIARPSSRRRRRRSRSQSSISSYTEVRAPFDGQMGKHLDRSRQYGRRAGPADGARRDHPARSDLCRRQSERAGGAARPRKTLGNRRLTLAEMHKYPVDVGLEGGQDYPYHGTIQYVAPAIDPKTGTMLVRGILHNPDRTLLPGFFVRIRLPAGKVIPNALLVPNRAMQTDQGGRYRDRRRTPTICSRSAMSSSANWTATCASSCRASSPTTASSSPISGAPRPGSKVTPQLTTLDRCGRGGEGDRP